MPEEEQKRNLIKNLDLSLVRARVKNENPDWDEAKLDKYEMAYRGFLFVCWKYPKMEQRPTPDLDEFWHAHILYTKKYAEDCDAIFGHFMHHNPD